MVVEEEDLSENNAVISASSKNVETRSSLRMF
jgi:hypothetical protein